MRVLQTQRLLLRPFHPEDAEDVFAYAQHPGVGPAAGWPPHESLEESRRIVRMFIQAGDVWAIVLLESGRVIGSIGLHKDTKRNHPGARMIGYVLSPAYWGRGLMPEAVRAVLRHAFMDLQLQIVSGVHFPFNTGSRRVIEKCGIRYEGTLRMATRLYSGEMHDDVCLSITREEFFS